MAAKAALLAIADAGLSLRAVDSLYVCLPDDFLSGLAFAEYLGLRPKFAENNRTCGFKPGHRRAIVRRNIVAEDLRSRRGADSARDHYIFNCNRNPAQRRQILSLGRERINLRRFGQRTFFRQREKRSNLRIVLLNLGVIHFGKRRSSGLALLDG